MRTPAPTWRSPTGQRPFRGMPEFLFLRRRGMDVGFIGLGTMGRAMAANLLKAGHHVRVWNRSPEPMQALDGQGAQACTGPSEAFQAGVVISMLADDEAIRQVLQDDVLVGALRSTIH